MKTTWVSPKLSFLSWLGRSGKKSRIVGALMFYSYHSNLTNRSFLVKRILASLLPTLQAQLQLSSQFWPLEINNMLMMTRSQMLMLPIHHSKTLNDRAVHFKSNELDRKMPETASIWRALENGRWYNATIEKEQTEILKIKILEQRCGSVSSTGKMKYVEGAVTNVANYDSCLEA